MASNTAGFIIRRPWTIAAAVVASLLIGWGFFHPEFRPDADTIPASVRTELAKTGFVRTKDVSAARLARKYFDEAFSENWTEEQKIIPVDALITEKRTRARTKGVTDEITGLYVGPFAVVEFTRTWPPLIGDLLPYQFWTSARMSEFVVHEIDGFPNTKGGTMRARVTYEERYASGKLKQIESRRLQCDIAQLVGARSLSSRLSGMAARIDCREDLEPNGRRVGAGNLQNYSANTISYSHWYISDRGWSIPIEGQRIVRLGDTDETVKWTSKLVSFESNGE